MLVNAGEKPFYTVEGKDELCESCKPAAPPNVKTKEYELLQKFCKKVEIILQVVTIVTSTKPPLLSWIRLIQVLFLKLFKWHAW